MMGDYAIDVTGISATGYHGVHEEERRLGQVFRVDCHLRVTIADHFPDEMGSTVSYSEIARGIHDIITGEPVQLIETLASRIGAFCLGFDQVCYACVTVHKPSAPIGIPFEDVAVTMEFSSDTAGEPVD